MRLSVSLEQVGNQGFTTFKIYGLFARTFNLLRNKVEGLVVSPFMNFSQCVTANITAEIMVIKTQTKPGKRAFSVPRRASNLAV